MSRSRPRFALARAEDGMELRVEHACASKPPATHLWGVWLAVFVAYGLTFAGHLSSPDDEVIYRTAESLATSATLALEPIVDGFATQTGLDGKDYAQYGIGQPLLAVPFVWMGRALSQAYSGTGLQAPVRRSGEREIPYRIIEMQFHDRSDAAWARRFAVSWFNVVLGACFATALYAFAFALSADATASTLTALLYALGTMAWPHSRTLFTEPLAALGILLAYWGLHCSLRRQRLRPALLAGCAAGYALLTRLDSVLALPGVAVYLALAHWERASADVPDRPTREDGMDAMDESQARSDDARHELSSSSRSTTSLSSALALCRCQFERTALARWLALGLPVVAALAIYGILNLIHFGNLRPAYADQPEGIDFGTPFLIGLHGFVCSIGRGLFFFSPPLLMFFWAIRRFAGVHRALGTGLIVSLALFLGVQSTWINWAGGWCWGPRHIFMIHWMLALPILVLLQAPRRPAVRIVYAALMALGIGIQVYGSSVNFSKYYKAHFYDVFEEPRAMALYDLAQEGYLRQLYDLKVRATPFSEAVEPNLYSSSIVAPINDSVYIFQNSQWPGNLRCLRRGMHDLFWLHLVQARSVQRSLGN